MWNDFTSGVMTANAGHRNKQIIDAAIEPLQRGLAQAWYGPSEYRLNAHLALQSILPEGYKKTIFLVTGSEAVEQAVKIVNSDRFIGNTGKTIVSFKHNYHGSTNAAAALSGEQRNQLDWPICVKGYCPQGRDAPDDLCYHGCFQESVNKIYRPGALIYSPYLGAYSAWLPPKYAQWLGDWTMKNDILLIDDEIQASYYRTGSSFGLFEYLPYFRPDIILGGKGATSLLPLSHLTIADRIVEDIPQGDYISTHSGNPACLAAYTAAVEWYKTSNIKENVVTMGEHIEELFMKHPSVLAVLGKGLARSVLFENTKEGIAFAHKVVLGLRERHFLLFDTGKPLLKLAPPLVVTKESIDALYEAFVEVVEGL